MYKALFLVIVILCLASCDKSLKASKPDNFIEEKVMEDILYDIKILRASKSKSFKVLKDNNVQVDLYVYNKYKVDSLKLRQNIEYYSSSSFKRLKDMEHNIELRLESNKKLVSAKLEEVDSLKKIKDSLKFLKREVKSKKKLKDVKRAKKK